uniref:ATP binding cassette subfamily A member 7 n=1 Tax=Otolemur garnettii TaxID=30611 RepID=H0XFP8_OTOGA
MAFWTQLMLLLWKNFTYRRRQPIQLLVELLWPLFLFFILVIVRHFHPPPEHHECHFPNKPLPSAGIVPWLQGLICNVNNTCFPHPTLGEEPQLLNNFNHSLVSRLLADAHAVLGGPSVHRTLADLRKLMPTLRATHSTGLDSLCFEMCMGGDGVSQAKVGFLTLCFPAFLPQPGLNRATRHRSNLHYPWSCWCHCCKSGSGLGIRTRHLSKCLAPIAQWLQCQPHTLRVRVPTLILLVLNNNDKSLSPQRSLGRFVEAAGDLAQELLTLPSLAELWALLRRHQGTDRPLELVSEALCSTKGPRSSGGPSLNLYEASDLWELVGQEPASVLADNNLSPACSGLIGTLGDHPLSRLLWKLVKPMLLGKLLFTPDTPFTRQLMAEVNRTFEKMAVIKDIQEVWGVLGPQIFTFMNNSANVATLQMLLQMWDKGRGRPGPGDQDRMEALRSFLDSGGDGYSWRDAYDNLGRLVGTLGRVMECITLDKVEAVPSEAALVSRALQLLEERRFWAGVVFLGPEDSPDTMKSPTPGLGPGHLRIKIRMDIDVVTRTNKIRDRFWDLRPAADSLTYQHYVWSGFVYLQDLLEQAAVRVLSGAAPSAGLYLQQMPYPCYVDDSFLRLLSQWLPLFLTLAWTYSVALTVKAVVREKETRLRDTMRSMGLSRAVLWLSWFLSCLWPFLVSAALLVLVVKLGDILPYSHPLVIFLLLADYAVVTVIQSFLLSTLFSYANPAAACSGLAYFMLYLPYVLCVAWRDELPTGGRVAVSLLSPAAFGFGCESLAMLELQGQGVQWHNLGTEPIADVFSLAQVSGLLLLDAVLYALATWYLEAVCPGQYGIPEPWNFLFRRSYWCGPQASKGPAPSPVLQDPKAVLVEEAPPGLNPGVSIRGLEKHFPGSPQPALRGLSLDFYQGHITAFLGHNGAGKTTNSCIPRSILSGLFPPSGGSAFILGYDIRSSMAAIRPHLGVCPQYNVLFDMLTVSEHIWFYGRLKGLSVAAVGPEQDRMLEDMGLVPKQCVQTRHLSGGMQRKLSVAIAFVGGSEVVILDEPTAGVDPTSRRSIWDLLLKYRQACPGRTLILSTHHLDEAELLGDRVVVVAGGRLCCCGSPLFLRRHLGSGYYLTLVKDSPPLITILIPTSVCRDYCLMSHPSPFSRKTELGRGSAGPGGLEGPLKPSFVHPDTSQVLALVQQWVPGARLVEELPHELVLVLPYVSALDGSFTKLFQELDRRLGELRLTGYGISDTSLEEIFLKVVEDCDLDANPEESSYGQYPGMGIAGSDLTVQLKMLLGDSALGNGEPAGSVSKTQVLQSSEPDAVVRVQGWALTLYQLRALLLKRFLLARRSRRGLFAQILMPALFVGLALTFSFIVSHFGHYPALKLNPAMYGAQVSFFSEDAPRDSARNHLLIALLREAGLEESSMQNSSHWAPACAEPISCQLVVPNVSGSGNWTPESPSSACQYIQPDCPAAARGSPPPQALTSSGEVIQNLTGWNLSDFLVKTYSSLVHHSLKTKKWVNEVRYGGFSLGGWDPGLPSGHKVGHSVEELRVLLRPQPGGALDHVLNNLTAWAYSLDAQNSLKVWFNKKGWHAMVAFVNRANNALLRAHLPPGPTSHTYSITTFNHPLNNTKEQLSEATKMASTMDVLVSICVVFAMSFIPASFTLVLIEERVTQAKHLQFMGGLPPTLYWLGNFLWDMCNYLVPACIVVLIFLPFQQKAYVAPGNLPALLLLLLLYGWSVTPLMYPASFFFSVPSTGYVVLICINLFIGFNGSMATFVLELFSDQSLQDMNRILKRVLLIFPHFCLGRGLIDMVQNQAMADVLEHLGDRQFQSPLRWEVVGKNLLAMAVQGPLFFFFTLLLQYRNHLRPQPKLRSLPPLGEEDEDVAHERERVVQGATQGDLLVLRDLTKVYRGQKMPAVDRLCLGIPSGECFGLLGVNGAGKTSTFRMVTGNTLPSGGEVVLTGQSVAHEPAAAYRSMGYCPQSDAIFELLTGREHLELFARLRGVPEALVAQTVHLGLERLGLPRYADQPAGTYSGGNKRKLVTAVALVGDPPVVFLDEPTTGMDPSARRFLWNSLLAVVREGRSVMLTSHSMEECEALCTRLAIMVNGRFRCLGSVQHLKSRFGAGYTLTLRVPSERSQPAMDFVAAAFQGSELREAHGGHLRFQLPLGGRCSLAHVFGELARNGAEHGVEDFSVSQTTLEEVFLYFSKDQGMDEDYKN